MKNVVNNNLAMAVQPAKTVIEKRPDKNPVESKENTFKDALKKSRDARTVKSNKTPEKKSVDEKADINKDDKVKKVDDESTAQDIKEVILELKSMLENMVELMDTTDSEELTEIVKLIEEVSALLDGATQGKEVQPQIVKAVAELNDAIKELVKADVNSKGIEIKPELLELAKESQDMVKEAVKLTDTSFKEALITETSAVNSNVQSTDSVIGKETTFTNDVEDVEDVDEELAKTESKENTKQTSYTGQTLKAKVKIVNKTGLQEAYGDENTDFDFLSGSMNAGAKLSGTNAASKLGQASQLTGAKDITEIVNQITQEISVNINEETTEMMMKLRPDHLGKMAMKIVIDRGIMIASFEVESQVVKEAIEAGLEDLKSSLADKGLDIQEFNVSVNKDDSHQDQMSRFFSSSKKQNMRRLLEDDVAEVEPVSSTDYTANSGYIYSSTGSLNILA